ncbi:T9SS type A sorting domain-containing protein [Fulvivirgaceae bacterium BMA12]|uniref:T9SS type A sorting domain-containing protein n=1 Tax=Agaribacillus aureus TaxID=3051825 RepID=A0ABT8L7I7_9BACT|nr:T9SS type A sorting domain-containing protein [Fulvivirgaceae bacterium BMA12]
MKLNLLFILFCLILISFSGFSQNNSKVLIISLDGWNSDIWDVAHTPNIDKLIENATYTYDGLTLAPAYNSTTWSSLLTGVWPEKHKVQDYTFNGNDFASHPHFFDYIEAQGIRTAMFSRNDSITTQIPTNAFHNVSFSSDAAVITGASDYIKVSDEVSAFFVQLDAASLIGVQGGFDARYAEYLKAIQLYDEQVGSLLTAVISRPDYSSENWIIVVTTNHGGQTDGTIGSNTRIETTPMIIFSGNFVRNRQFLLDVLTAEKDKDNAVFLRPDRSEYVEIPIAGTKLEDMSDFTVELRVKPKDASSDPVIIGDKDWGSGGNPGWLIARQGSAWQINIANQTRTRRDIDLGPDDRIEDDLWHHLAFTVDKDGDAVVYTDGRESARTFLGYGDADSFKSPYDKIVMGQDGTTTYPSEWKGVIDEVRIFDKVVDSLTIVNWLGEKNVENTHPDKDHIIGYWKMDEHEGTKVTDYSGNDYHGNTVGTKRVPANGAITHVDIAPTVMAHLGININPGWGLDGGVVDLLIPDIVLGVEHSGFRTKDVTIYPNPASDRLNFKFHENLKNGEQVVLEVYNMLGEKFRSETLVRGVNQLVLDISSLQRGHYIYRVSGKRFKYTGTFIINN